MANDNEDIAWREYNVHKDYGRPDILSAQEDEDASHQQPVDIFAPRDAYDTQEYSFDGINGKVTITLREQKDYDVSTGMAIWKGSEILCQYMINHPDLIRNKRVLELGAGVGLCGVVSAKVLGASSVL
eukprot:CAMPEP_0172566572 /NCGR_PEP_ID=MMETSP1067-20121228/112352_1 /TAXON_ID=265564 ORGANISM="Thalassiosira punctigera, Strain Tpunct2005C2" /NCGR_SAMPLE_ID=MMETSP1067 /ASSEMBLY_ACC=CAM_ASM_000444 /LENGTH=127 /DNA_ID=CAMNT_0013357721 /DNA_START=19 /DNA_END=398 /DNA_ORIENTATION=-